MVLFRYFLLLCLLCDKVLAVLGSDMKMMSVCVLILMFFLVGYFRVGFSVPISASSFSGDVGMFVRSVTSLL